VYSNISEIYALNPIYNLGQEICEVPAWGGSMNTSMAFGLELARDKAQYNEEKGEFVRLVKQIRCS